MSTLIKSFPKLYKKSSSGKIQFWQIQVSDTNTEECEISTIFGQLDGKKQNTSDIISSGKNLGKANETTALEQALLEAESKWTKQIERKGYVSNKEDLDRDLRPGAEPMLAQRYDKYSEKIEFPCAIQPKLDGHRCIAVYENGKASLFSRQRKPITGLPHIEDAIVFMMRGASGRIILDGELYNHDFKDNFEHLTSHIRNESPKDGYTDVQYHMYDLVNLEHDFLKRHRALHLIYSGTDEQTSKYLKLVTTERVDESDVTKVFRLYRSQGYEGAMLRNYKSLYVGKRSYDLQKVKEFDDSEFRITGVEEGRGKMKGHAIFVCETSGGKEFKAKMRGSLELLAEIFENQSVYIGKSLTVMYQGLTKDGIPRFPVGVRVREDL